MANRRCKALPGINRTPGKSYGKAPKNFEPQRVSTPAKFGLLGGIGAGIKGIGSLVKGGSLKDAGKAALGGLVGGTGLMKKSGTPCPGCPSMCPQCRPGSGVVKSHCN